MGGQGRWCTSRVTRCRWFHRSGGEERHTQDVLWHSLHACVVSSTQNLRSVPCFKEFLVELRPEMIAGKEYDARVDDSYSDGDVAEAVFGLLELAE